MDGVRDSPEATISQLANSQPDGSVEKMFATMLGLTLILDFQHPHGGKRELIHTSYPLTSIHVHIGVRVGRETETDRQTDRHNLM